MGLYDTTIGAVLVGILFNTFLYGLVTYQFAAYRLRKFDDRPITKCTVFFLFILDTFHSASLVYLAWTYTVTNFDNSAVFEVAEWPYEFTALATALIPFVTQLFLGSRIWRLTNSKILYGVIVLLAINSFTLGIILSIKAWLIPLMSDLPRITPFVIAALASQVVTDSFVTITLIIIFSRSRTGFRRTDAVLNRLIRGAAQTGLFAGIFSLGGLICLVVLPRTNLASMFTIPLGRIYTNTLMDNLLARESLKAKLCATYDVSKELGEIDWGVSDPSQTTSKPRSTNDQLEAGVQSTAQQTYEHSTPEDVQSKAVSPAV